ncbi:MAG TPA: hypothetical protein VFF04_06945 [Candidatus Babeliales bacterium]|nr:hypothetical protein [Candidatus Babeliales bacterium]
MDLRILLMREDFITVVKDMGILEINDDFFTLRKIAQKEDCLFISTIDDKGVTVINSLQIDFLSEEITNLRQQEVNQKILDKLQQVLDEVRFTYYIYIKFMNVE